MSELERSSSPRTGFSQTLPSIQHPVGRDDATERLGAAGRNVLIFVLLAWIVDAADSTIYSLTIPQIREEFGLSLRTMGIIASVFLAGTVIGAAILPMIAERKGRRVGMALCISLFSICTGLVGVAHSVGLLVIGRFLTGSGSGAEWPIGAAYLTEMVPAKRRGAAMALMQAGYPFGFFLAAGLFAWFSSMGLGWRACYLVLVIPAIMCLPVLYWLEESPTWQMRQASRTNASDNAKPRTGIRNLFIAQNRRYTWIAIGLHVFGAISGYGLIVWLPSAVTIDFGFTKAETAHFVMLSWGVGALGYLAAGPLSDRFGRKPILSLFTLMGLGAVGYLDYLRRQADVPHYAVLIAGVFIGISLAVSAIYIAYTSEIFPAALRGPGLGLSIAIGKVTAVFVPLVLAWIAQYSSISQALLLSTGLGVLMIPIILLGPETARKRLEDIHEEMV